MRKKYVKGQITLDEIQANCIIDNAGCWIWQRAKMRFGYGQLRRYGKIWPVHRLTYFLHAEDAPLDVLINPKLFICHKCDVAACCNPEHLFIGDASLNTKDKVLKNRQTMGYLVSISKLKELDIPKILKLKTAGFSNAAIGRKYNVARGTIRKIVNGNNWKQITKTNWASAPKQKEN